MFDFNALRLEWGWPFLVEAPDTRISLSEKLPRIGCYTINVHLLAGWYMIELRLHGQGPHRQARLNLQTESSLTTLGMAISTAHVSKRLVYFPDRGRIAIEVDDFLTTDRIDSFRLARVTTRFARSRMLSKLKVLHPKYRRCGDGYDISSIRSKHLDTGQAWQDYCSLFEKSRSSTSYLEWAYRFDTPSPDVYKALHDSVRHLAIRPVFAVCLEISEAVVQVHLQAAISSVVAQIYPDWRLLIVDRRSSTYSADLLPPKLRDDARISVISNDASTEVGSVLNRVLADSGSWITFLGQNDVLPRHCLYVVADAINRNPNVDLIYSDEDSLDTSGARHSPRFKCDWNEDLMLSSDLFANLGVYRTNSFSQAGGLDEAYGVVSRYDLTLRCLRHTSSDRILHIPRVLYHTRAEPELMLDPIALRNAREESRRAVERHLSRAGVPATVTTEEFGHRIRYPVPDSAPLVTLIIPTRNGLALLSQCVTSILERTRYRPFEIIIVDNGSDDPDTLSYIAQLSTSHSVRVLRDDSPFNYSTLNNRAVEIARGEFVALINNDVEVIDGDWLDEVMGHALRPEIGVVGVKLLYSNNTVQHAGVIIGLSGCADHLYCGLERDAPGYMARAVLTQSYSAVTAACLIVRRSLYRELGGLNERDLTVAFNDVDFCLRVRQAGYRILWTPYAVLYHHEHATRGGDDTPEKVAHAKREADYIRRHWPSLIADDPAYSPNLSLDRFDCSLAWPPRVPPLAQLVRRVHEQ